MFHGYSPMKYDRRQFMTAMTTGAAGLVGLAYSGVDAFSQTRDKSRVAVVPGFDRREMVYQAMKPFEDVMKKAVGNRQIIIKPNCVWHSVPLAATHPDAMRGVLDFLKPWYKKPVVIAESTTSPEGTLTAFNNYGYMDLEREYGVRLVDLNKDASTTVHWILGKDHHPVPVRIIDTFIDPNVYFISVTRLKTHDYVVATLSVKNMVMAAPVNEYAAKNDKPVVHQGVRAMNYNMFQLARTIRPDFSVLDGVEGMEGNGPVGGTAIGHGVMVAGEDSISVDRIGVELMGIDFSDVGYLTYCHDAGIGIGDRAAIEIIGSDPSAHIKTYKLHDKIDMQLEWKKS